MYITAPVSLLNPASTPFNGYDTNSNVTGSLSGSIPFNTILVALLESISTRCSIAKGGLLTELTSDALFLSIVKFLLSAVIGLSTFLTSALIFDACSLLAPSETIAD